MMAWIVKLLPVIAKMFVAIYEATIAKRKKAKECLDDNIKKQREDAADRIVRARGNGIPVDPVVRDDEKH